MRESGILSTPPREEINSHPVAEMAEAPTQVGLPDSACQVRLVQEKSHEIAMFEQLLAKHWNVNRAPNSDP
jgi:hypothetical protein